MTLSLYYRVPMTYASWGWQELLVVARALCRPPLHAPRELAGKIAELYGRSVSLWSSGRAALGAVFQYLATSSPHRRRVLMPSLLCRSVAEQAVAAGLAPVFYDVRPDFSPDLGHAMSLLDAQTSCVLVAHLYGKVVAIDHLAQVCRDRGILLIEDCAASFLLRRLDGTLSGLGSDLALFSFNTGKTLVAGSGGALINGVNAGIQPTEGWTMTEERAAARRKIWVALAYAWPALGYALLRNLPFQRAAGRIASMLRPKPISSVDAALVRVQWRRWPGLYSRRQQIIERYAKNLRDVEGVRLLQYRPGAYLTRLFVEFPVNLNNPALPRFPVAEFLKARGVQVHLPYRPFHRHPAFAGFSASDLPVTERLADCSLAVPTQPELRDWQVDYVCQCIREAAVRLREDKLVPELPGEAPMQAYELTGVD